MTSSPHELARLDALARNRIVGTVREPEFDDLARIAAGATGCPMAFISFVDHDRIWLKASHGLDMEELPREHSFCAAAIEQALPLTVHDAAADPRFADYVLVSKKPRVRAYAAAPIHEQGWALGTIAVLDTKPRQLEGEQLKLLERLARQVLCLLELRRLRDKRLLKSEALLASATRISGIGCWQWNMLSGEITWSSEMYEIFGLPHSVVPTIEAFHSRVHPDDREQVAARTKLTLEGAMTEFPDYRVERPNGEVRIVQATAELEHDASGRPALLTGALLDVTEQRQAEEARKKLAMQVMQSQKLESLSVLSAGVAHDFNNLLVGILGNAELAAADVELSAMTRELMERVTEAAVQAAALTRQLLAYTGRSHLEMIQLDLSGRAQDVLHALRSSLPSNIVLTVTLPRPLPSIEADAEQLQQIIANLVINAAESYGGAGGEVRVRTYVATFDEEPTADIGQKSRDTELTTEQRSAHDVVTQSGPLRGRYVVLEVADQGAGMSRETLERVCEPFFSTKFTGRGLGLAAVLGITRAHRGVLTADSHVGHGSCFRVHFPLLERLPKSHGTRKSQSAAGQALAGYTVLVVDDEARVRQLERRVLEGCEVRVLEASSGDEAVELLQHFAGPVHLVLLDLVMPGLDSVSTLHALRTLRPDVAVVIQSGYSAEEVTSRLREIDEDIAFLAKPFSPKSLVEKIVQQLKR